MDMDDQTWTPQVVSELAGIATEAEAACAVKKLAELGVPAQYRETNAGWNVFQGEVSHAA